jgi:hypothetical protein
MNNNKKTMMDDIASFQNAGFRLADKASALKVDIHKEFDPHSPDGILVSKNDVSGAALKHGIACMYANSRNNTYIYTALNKTTTDDKIEALENMGGFFYKIPDGTHVGYIPLNDKPIAPGVDSESPKSFTEALEDISLLELDTVKMPMHHSALGLLPFFAEERSNPSMLTEEQLIDKLASNLGDFSEVMDMTPQQKDIMDRKFNNIKFDNDEKLSRSYAAFKPSMS